MKPELLDILCCPETHQRLNLATPAQVEAVNKKIAAGQANSIRGMRVTEAIEGGLMRSDGKAMYPIRRDIPVMLINEAISME